MHAPPRLLAVSTAVPPYPLDQNDVVERVKLLFGRSENLDRLFPVFTNTGIRTRYSCVPIEWYDRAHGWAERNRIYLASALDLLESATRQLLDRTGRDKSEIDSIVVVSTTGIATPSLDALRPGWTLSGSQSACVPPPSSRARGLAAWRPLRQLLARAPCCNGPVLHAATPRTPASATRCRADRSWPGDAPAIPRDWRHGSREPRRHAPQASAPARSRRGRLRRQAQSA